MSVRPFNVSNDSQLGSTVWIDGYKDDMFCVSASEEIIVPTGQPIEGRKPLI